MEKYRFVNENRATELKKQFTDILLSIQLEVSKLGFGGYLIRIVGSSKYNFIIDYSNNHFEVDFQLLFESKANALMTPEVLLKIDEIIKAELLKRNIDFKQEHHANNLSYIDTRAKRVFNVLVLKKSSDKYFLSKKALKEEKEIFVWSEVPNLTTAFDKFAKDNGKHIKDVRNNYWDKRNDISLKNKSLKTHMVLNLVHICLLNQLWKLLSKASLYFLFEKKEPQLRDSIIALRIVRHYISY